MLDYCGGIIYSTKHVELFKAIWLGQTAKYWIWNDGQLHIGDWMEFWWTYLVCYQVHWPEIPSSLQPELFKKGSLSLLLAAGTIFCMRRNLSVPWQMPWPMTLEAWWVKDYERIGQIDRYDFQFLICLPCVCPKSGVDNFTLTFLEQYLCVFTRRGIHVFVLAFDMFNARYWRWLLSCWSCCLIPTSFE